VIVLLGSESNNVLLETGMAIGAGKAVLIVGREPESLPSELRLFPFLYLSGVIESDVASILDRVRSIRVEDERPHSTYRTVHEKLNTYHSDPAFFESLSPTEFEDLLIDWLLEHGFEPERPAEPSVYGIDIVARSPEDGSTLVIEAKKFSRQSRVSLKDVMALLAAAMLTKAEKAILITSSSFTAAALQMASESHGPRLCLWTMDDLLLSGDPVKLLK
jgi:HJR/Mrr/RecB family endonuclease